MSSPFHNEFTRKITLVNANDSEETFVLSEVELATMLGLSPVDSGYDEIMYDFFGFDPPEGHDA